MFFGDESGCIFCERASSHIYLSCRSCRGQTSRGLRYLDSIFVELSKEAINQHLLCTCSLCILLLCHATSIQEHVLSGHLNQNPQPWSMQSNNIIMLSNSNGKPGNPSYTVETPPIQTIVSHLHGADHNGQCKHVINKAFHPPTHHSAKTYPTTAFKLKPSKNVPKSSFFTSTTQCSKLSIRTLAPVSSTTS